MSGFEHVQWAVVVENEEGSNPEVVLFRTKGEADEWMASVNAITDQVWPDSFHNHARAPQLTMDAAAMEIRIGREVAEEGGISGQASG